MWQKIIPEILSAIGDKKLSIAVSKLKFIFLPRKLYYKSVKREKRNWEKERASRLVGLASPTNMGLILVVYESIFGKTKQKGRFSKNRPFCFVLFLRLVYTCLRLSYLIFENVQASKLGVSDIFISCFSPPAVESSCAIGLYNLLKYSTTILSELKYASEVLIA